MWGLSRTLVNNMVTGVTKGFEQKLELVGVGYRAAMKGKTCARSSASATTSIYPTRTASPSRCRSRPRSRSPASTSSWSARSPRESAAIRPPEPYKGKGVRYAGEKIRRKEGKKK